MGERQKAVAFGTWLSCGDITLLEETNASGAAQADYIYLDGRPVAVLNGSTLYYLHDDMLGTPQLATDSNQAVQWQASYDPFGEASVSGWGSWTSGRASREQATRKHARRRHAPRSDLLLNGMGADDDRRAVG